MNNGELLSVLEYIKQETDISEFHTREVPCGIKFKQETTIEDFETRRFLAMLYITGYEGK